MSSPERLPVAALGLLLALAAAPFPSAAEQDGDDPGSAVAGARLLWDFADDLDLIGDMWAELPHPVGRDLDLFFRLDTRTTIRKAESDFTFKLRDLDYALDLGLRSRRFPRPGIHGSLFLAQRGREGVDRSAQPWVRFLGVGLESEGFRRLRDAGESAARGFRGIEWRVAGGPVFDDREIEADFMLRGGARLLVVGGGHPSGALLEVELHADGLVADGHVRADLTAGPSLSFPLGGGKRARLLFHYQRSRNPLGIGHSALLAGFEYSGDAGGGFPAPEIDGAVAAGAGAEGRLAGVLDLRLLSPAFGRDLRAAFVMNANVLTADDTGELYYLYHLGVERLLGDHAAGIYFYHRSNHQLAEPNDRITSLNVIEAGIETGGWRRVGRCEGPRRRAGLEARAAFGYLINSTFGEERRWHARGGLRWTPPLPTGRFAPFVGLELEAGDVERQSYLFGAALGRDAELRLELRNDRQYFSRDRTALLVLARFGF